MDNRRAKLEKRLELLQHALSSEALALFPDFQQRLGVLRRYTNYTNIMYGSAAAA